MKKSSKENLLFFICILIYLAKSKKLEKNHLLGAESLFERKSFGLVFVCFGFLLFLFKPTEHGDIPCNPRDPREDRVRQITVFLCVHRHFYMKPGSGDTRL